MPNKRTQNRSSWPVSKVALTDDPGFYVVFHGLFAFAYNREENICEVGTHAKNDDHKFGLFIVELEGRNLKVEGRTPKLIYSFTPDSPSDADSPLVLELNDRKRKGVRFYEADDDEGWGRLPDIEGRYFYNKRVDKVKNAMKPRLHIHDGIMFTALTTYPYTFNCYDEDDKKVKYYIGPVAYMPAVELSQGDGGYLSLKSEHQEIRLAEAANKQYVIFFANLCPDCRWYPNSLDKKKRNDFYLHYRLFKKPKGCHEYGLKLAGQIDPSEPADERAVFFNYLINEVVGPYVPRSSKNSPCGGMGFGSSMGIG